MRDPHVQALYFNASSDVGTAYQPTASLSFENALGKFEVAANGLKCIPAEDFSSREAARAAIEPFLQAWEISTDLVDRFGALRFSYERADVVDRSPPPAGTLQAIQAEGFISFAAGGSVVATAVLNEYPKPPSGFEATSTVAMCYRRWMKFKAGKEPLQAMAYFVLSVVETAAKEHISGGAKVRTKASRMFCVDEEVLSTIANYASARGGEESARKADPKGAYADLTAAETAWLDHATRVLIRRIGEHAAGAEMKRVSLRDLPHIQ